MEYEVRVVMVGRAVVVGLKGVGFLVGRFGLGLYPGFGLSTCFGARPKIPPKKFNLPRK